MNTSSLNIHLSPLVPEPVIYAMVAAAIFMLLVSAFLYKRGMFWRLLCTAGFITILLNPSIVEEDRKPVSDIVAIVVDRSPSQDYGQRMKRTDASLAYLKEQIGKLPGIEIRTVEAPANADRLDNETNLFGPLDHILSDVPLKRRAGVIFLTDGQIHDLPANEDRLDDYGPVHALLTGERGERDRQLVVLEAPAYGIVGQDVTIRYRIEDTGNIGEEFATIVARTNDKAPQIDLVPVGEDLSITITIGHAGQNIVDLQASPVDKEITLANNRAPLIINGVRDRLRVLLVSGQPHTGGRTWRNLLTSDPGVDLVHFTILREPNKLDATPQNELSLIAFPFRELFEVKLYDFDLIIFDRYRLNRILPNYYFANIANYVKKGGALLEASGPSFATGDSVYTTALKDVLPAYPTGKVYQQAYRPGITETGYHHPVTQDLVWTNHLDKSSQWGSWLRQVSVHPVSGDVLMTGAQDSPLLILDRVGEGRVAQLASDHIWLWSRGFEGGGPQAELLRRLAHWLMKEPELEENALDVDVSGRNITITRRSLNDDPITVTITKPDASTETLELVSTGKGRLQGKIKGDSLGIYTVDDGQQKRFAVVGDLNPPELRGVITTPNIIEDAARLSKGGVKWLQNEAKPDIRLLPPDRNYSGDGWLGLRKNRSFNVMGVKDHPFMPSWLYALGLLTLLIAAWWFEGRSGGKTARKTNHQAAS